MINHGHKSAVMWILVATGILCHIYYISLPCLRMFVCFICRCVNTLISIIEVLQVFIEPRSSTVASTNAKNKDGCFDKTCKGASKHNVGLVNSSSGTCIHKHVCKGD